MHSLNESFQITSRGLKYNLIYGLFFLAPFFFCLGKTGMTFTIGKTLGYATQPLLLLSWIVDLDFFHKYFPIITATGIIINFFILLWLGSLAERNSDEI